VAVSDEFALGILNSRLTLRGIVTVEDWVILPPVLKHISKHSNVLLRFLLVEAAQVTVRLV
jgi:hypothetical protein